ncbi:MAG: cytochrome c biogenesis protein CcsA [Candidatus Eisenbacteria bacterium]|nr:cytochrome c biogenesis protein CcsA [Candidatus Eisenbacteria bacterium]
MYILGSILRWAVLAGYLVSAVLYIARLRGRHPRHADVAAALLLATLTLHTLLLGETFLETGRLQFLRSGLSAMTLLALALSAITLILSARLKNASLGAFTVPLAALFQVLSLVDRPSRVGIDPLLDSYWFEVHLTSAFLGYAAFGLAFAAGIMYLALAGSIRSRRIGNLFERLPSLTTLDRLGSIAALTGLLFFTIGLISGAVWSSSATGRPVSGEPKELLALITWLLFAGQVFLRWRSGWHGRRSALLSIAGFVAALVTILGGGSGRHPL